MINSAKCAIILPEKVPYEVIVMKIGNVEIKGYTALAPMAGVADRAFRELCKDFGASYVVSEMVSSKGIEYSNKKTQSLMQVSPKEHPCAVQIFGSEPEIMAQSAKEAVNAGADIIDINMGCPAPKIVNNGCGSALMKDPQLCGEIVTAVSKSVDVPVTVKIRKGWNSESVNALQVARICQQNGAKAVTIHGRTREDMYKPYADWDIIKLLKQNLDIPVIGNGDITCAEDAEKMIEHTGCDLVMIGRGALGNPMIFSEINAWFNDFRQLPKASVTEKVSALIKQAELAVKYKGERIAIREMRKHAAWYFKGFEGAAALRDEAGRAQTLEQLQKLCAKALIMNNT